MPKHKAKIQEDSDSDSGPDDREPVKKAKTTPQSKGSSKKPDKPEDDNELSWDLGRNRFIKLTEFKGKWYVNIREFYNADGELKPGKKGLMLTMEQWQKFKGFLPDIEEAIKRNI